MGQVPPILFVNGKNSVGKEVKETKAKMSHLRETPKSDISRMNKTVRKFYKNQCGLLNQKISVSRQVKKYIVQSSEKLVENLDVSGQKLLIKKNRMWRNITPVKQKYMNFCGHLRQDCNSADSRNLSFPMTPLDHMIKIIKQRRVSTESMEGNIKV